MPGPPSTRCNCVRVVDEKEKQRAYRWGEQEVRRGFPRMVIALGTCEMLGQVIRIVMVSNYAVGPRQCMAMQAEVVRPEDWPNLMHINEKESTQDANKVRDRNAPGPRLCMSKDA